MLKFLCDGQGAVRHGQVLFSKGDTGLWIHCNVLSPFFSKGDNLYDFLLATLEDKSFQKGSILVGKNLLQEEQVLSFKK